MNTKEEKTTFTYEERLVKRVEVSVFDISIPDWQYLKYKIKLIPDVKASNKVPSIGFLFLGATITILISALTSSKNQIIFWALGALTLALGLICVLAFTKKRDKQIYKLKLIKADISSYIELIEERYEKTNNGKTKRQEDQ